MAFRPFVSERSTSKHPRHAKSHSSEGRLCTRAQPCLLRRTTCFFSSQGLTLRIFQVLRLELSTNTKNLTSVVHFAFCPLLPGFKLSLNILKNVPSFTFKLHIPNTDPHFCKSHHEYPGKNANAPLCSRDLSVCNTKTKSPHLLAISSNEIDDRSCLFTPLAKVPKSQRTIESKHKS